MTAVNCTYTTEAGIFVQQICAVDQTYCCQSSAAARHCSTTVCSDSGSADSGDGLDVSTIAFWCSLGGLLLVCCIVIGIVYVVCYNRNRHCCFVRNPVDELLETTLHQEEVHTVTSETHVTGFRDTVPAVVRRMEHVRRVTRKQTSRNDLFRGQPSVPVTIRVSPRGNPAGAKPVTPRDLDRLVLTDTPDTRAGQQHVTSIGCSQ